MPDRTATVSRPLRSPKTARISVKATRPAIVDLRFREDAWIVPNGSGASVCLGDYHLCEVATTRLDVAGLNNLFVAVRLGQARREMYDRQRRG